MPGGLWTKRRVPPDAVRMRILVVQHEDGTGPGLVGERLVALGAELDLRHPWAGQELPADLAEHDGLIVLGGAPAAYEAVAWFPAVFELLREAVRRDVPTLGICLGAQLLAVACGGEVRRAARGEAGLCALELYANPDPLFGSVPRGVRSVQWHRDEVSVLPVGAVPLMSCAHGFPHQAFRMGSRVWAVQFHPEVLIDDVRLWAASDPVDDLGIDVAAMLGEVAAAGDELRAVWGDFAERWYALACGASQDTTKVVASAEPVS